MSENQPKELLDSLTNLYTTEIGVGRIRRNLSLEYRDVVAWCCQQIESPDALIYRRGKNWYVEIGTGIITINTYSCIIITAHKKKLQTD